MSSSTNYDSNFCGSLPLQHINIIQSYGYLLVAERESLRIVQVSENVVDLFGKSPAETVGSSLKDYITAAELESLEKKVTTGISEKIPLTLSIAGKQTLALIHLRDNYLLLELEEQRADEARSFTDVFQEVRFAMAAIAHTETVEEASRVAIHELRRLSGFDGIMMYRFDENWNGTVIAEEKSEGLDHYLGLTFPASDVPKQARQLYLKNAYRLIPDRDYKPVKLYPVINPITSTFTDMADCNLRGVAAVHLEYLKNMNVTASMSIRVIHNDELWGLISCHHKTAKHLSFELCSVFEMLSAVISQKISSVLHREHYTFISSLQNKQTELTETIFTHNDLLKGFAADDGKALMELFGATGATLWQDGHVHNWGDVPDEHFLDNFYLWLQTKVTNSIFSSQHFADVYQDAGPFAEMASGVLVIPVQPQLGEYLALFRPEVKRVIKWGGDPSTAIQFEPDRKNYHPRNSFALWQQTVDQMSLPWRTQEQETADHLRSFFYEFSTR